MTDSVMAITYDRTSYSGVLASNVVSKGRIEAEQVVQTIYPNGLTVTRIYHDEIEVYDNRAVVSQHNKSHTLDMMI